MGKSRKARKSEDGRYLAGILDGRGTLELARLRIRGRCYVEPRIGVRFSMADEPVAKAVKELTEGRIVREVIKGKPFHRVVVEGYEPIERVSRKVLPYMKSPTKSYRIRKVAERAKGPKPIGLCTPEEEKAPRGMLASVFFKDRP